MEPFIALDAGALLPLLIAQFTSDGKVVITPKLEGMIY
jgi:hypothetical protein